MGKQLSQKALLELCRPHAVEAIKELVRLMNEGQNDNVKLGAAKSLLAKTLPDLRAVEMKDGDGNKIIPVYIQMPEKKK